MAGIEQGGAMITGIKSTTIVTAVKIHVVASVYTLMTPAVIRR